jgi:hypothetical protein
VVTASLGSFVHAGGYSLAGQAGACSSEEAGEHGSGRTGIQQYAVEGRAVVRGILYMYS